MHQFSGGSKIGGGIIKKKRISHYFNIICIGKEGTGRRTLFETFKVSLTTKLPKNKIKLNDETEHKTEAEISTSSTVPDFLAEQPAQPVGFLSLFSEKDIKEFEASSEKSNLSSTGGGGGSIKRKITTKKREISASSLVEKKITYNLSSNNLPHANSTPSPPRPKTDGTVGFLSLTSIDDISYSMGRTKSMEKFSFNYQSYKVTVHFVEEFASIDINLDDNVGFLFLYSIDSKDSFNFMKTQLSTTSKFSSTHSSIIIGTKCEDLREVSFNEADALSKKHNMPYKECSAFKNINVEDSVNDLLSQMEYEYSSPAIWELSKRDIKEKLSLAIIQKNLKKIKSMVAKEQSNNVGKSGWAPIHVACWEGLYEVVFMLIQVNPVCVFTTGKENWTPLHIAARMGYFDIVHLLLNSGSNVLDKDSLNRPVCDGQSRKVRDYLQYRINSRKRNQNVIKDSVVVDNHGNIGNNVSNNNFAKFDKIILEEVEKEMTEIDLSHCGLTLIPSEIKRLVNLTWVSLCYNSITEINVNLLTSCKSLQTLILSFNQIVTIPPEIINLSWLEYLDLRNNKISTLPACFGEMKALKKCFLSFNQLTYLPSTIEHFEKTIEAFDLYGNPLNTLPPDIVPKLGDIHPSEMPHLFAYLRDISEGQQEYNRIKIMLVGDGNVGKTSLGNCFAVQEARKASRISTKIKKMNTKEPTDTIATDGIDISEVIVPLSGKEIIWDIWDYAGQDIYYTTHQFFLTKRAIYLIVFNLLDRNLMRVEYWLNSIHSRARGSPIILVGTHCDHKDCTEEYINDYSNHLVKTLKPERFKSNLGVKSVRGIYFISSKKKIGIKDLMEGMKDIITKQKWEGQLFPTSWLKLEESVTSLKKSAKNPVIQWNDFKLMAEGVGVPPNSVKDATLFLHTIGTLCYYDDEKSGLDKVVIIDPQFLTDVMSSIITLKHRFAQGTNMEGILFYSQLPHIWKHFPADIQPMLLKLLESFEICFKLPTHFSFTSPPADLSDSDPIDVPLIRLLGKKESSSPQSSAPSTPRSDSGDEERIIIPSLLGDDQPNLKSYGWSIALGQKTKLFVFSRIYDFEFLPLGFFPRLFVRNFHIPDIDIVCFWRNGLLIQRGEIKALVRFNSTRYRLTLDISTPQNSYHECVKLLRILVENIESTIEGWYETKVEISLSCPHCVQDGSYEPWKFSLNDCLTSITKGKGFVLCQNIRRIRVDMIAPDLSFVDFQRLVVPFESIELNSVIGQGAFGTVHKGRLNNQPVAVKQILFFKNESNVEVNSSIPLSSEELLSQEEDALELQTKFNEFQREVWIMSCLHHRNLCGLVAICNQPMAMVIDFLPLGDLYKLIESFHLANDDPKLEEKRAELAPITSIKVKLRIVYEIAKGMNHLHRLSPPIIHRDLRSPNIFVNSLDLSEEACIKIGDFGLSRLISSPLAGGDFNANWLAPEVMKGEKYDHKLDIYSFAIIMWELISLQKPFEEYDKQFSGKPKSMFYAAVIGGLRPTIPADCDEDYKQLMIACWAGSPDLRPEFFEILAKLEPILAKHNVPLSLEEDSFDQSNDTSNSNNILSSKRSSKRQSKRNRIKSGDTMMSDQADVVSLQQRFDTSSHSHEQSIQKILIVLLDKEDLVTIWAASADGYIFIWDSITFELVSKFNVTESRIYDMTIVGSEIWIATSDGAIISIARAKEKKVLFTLREHVQTVRALLLVDEAIGSSDKLRSKSKSSKVISGDVEGNVVVWETRNKKQSKAKQRVKLSSAVGSMVQKDEIIYIGTENSIFLFNIISNTLSDVTLVGHTNLVNGMVYVNHYLWSCGSDGVIRIWNTKTNTCVKELKAHSAKVLCMSAIGNYVFTGSFDMILAVWDAKTLELLQELKGVYKDGIRSLQTIGDIIITGGMERDPYLCTWKLSTRKAKRKTYSRTRR